MKQLLIDRFTLPFGTFTNKDENAAPVIKKRNHDGTVEYEPDTELRDTEHVLLKESMEAFIEYEVRPHVPDAWIDHARTQVGYEISFTRVFYKYQPLRSLEEITKDILALEAETEGLLHRIIEVN